MSKTDWATIDSGIVQGIYIFKKDTTQGQAQAYFPTMDVVDVTDTVPQPGPKWTYDGIGFFPPAPEPPPAIPPFIPMQSARNLVATIDFAKLDDDVGKALICIMYALNILEEKV